LVRNKETPMMCLLWLGRDLCVLAVAAVGLPANGSKPRTDTLCVAQATP